jgi:hypothetical protein
MSEERFWEVVGEAQTRGLVENRRGMYTIPTLAGARVLEAKLAASQRTTHNTISIGTNINSPIQQAGAGSHQEQTISLNQEDVARLQTLIGSFRANLQELSLDATAERKAKAQLSTIEAQLQDEPDPVIVRQAGRSLRNVTEGAIGSLLANGTIALDIWAPIMTMLQTF